MRPPSLSMSTAILTRFSILLRIVELADVSALALWPAIAFQYPLADRRACGQGHADRHAAPLGFQYPLADRRACGTMSPPPSRAAPPSFSILLRIVELAGLSFQHTSSTMMFQYPLADRRACGIRCQNGINRLEVSVSSCGS